MFNRSWCWFLLIGACLLFGAVVSARRFVWEKPSWSDAQASVRRLGKDALEIDDFPEKLQSVLARIPRDGAIILMCSAQEWQITEVQGALSYLAWPRALWVVPVGDSGRYPIEAAPPPQGTRPAAVFLFRMAPPENARGEVIALGPNLLAVLP